MVWPSHHLDDTITLTSVPSHTTRLIPPQGPRSVEGWDALPVTTFPLRPPYLPVPTLFTHPHSCIRSHFSSTLLPHPICTPHSSHHFFPHLSFPTIFLFIYHYPNIVSSLSLAIHNSTFAWSGYIRVQLTSLTPHLSPLSFAFPTYHCIPSLSIFVVHLHTPSSHHMNAGNTQQLVADGSWSPKRCLGHKALNCTPNPPLQSRAKKVHRGTNILRREGEYFSFLSSL